MEEKRLGVYQINEAVFIQAYSETVDGINTLDGPSFQSKIEDIQRIGQTILEAFKECKLGIPDFPYERYDNKTDPLLLASKMKNWSSLQKLSLSVLIKKKADLVKFTPKKFMGNTGPNRGYEWLEDKAIETEDLSPENLGRCLVEALARSENPFLKV
ncbi:MAG: hypothetical protein FJX18_05610 [Alphaproteobacteria bacterium]|nr:hypothetical protein [Alphaproteobacteria bacterium]